MRDRLQMLVCSTLCLAAVGCAVMKAQTPEQLYLRHRALLKLAVQIGVVEFVHRHKNLAPHIAQAGGICRDTLVGTSGDMPFIASMMQKEMTRAQISTTDQALILNLLETLSEVVRAYFIEKEILPAAVLLYVSDVCEWISEAAALGG